MNLGHFFCKKNFVVNFLVHGGEKMLLIFRILFSADFILNFLKFSFCSSEN
jgi:hypothetical protein